MKVIKVLIEDRNEVVLADLETDDEQVAEDTIRRVCAWYPDAMITRTETEVSP